MVAKPRSVRAWPAPASMARTCDSAALKSASALSRAAALMNFWA